jgi:hypothetical protein
MKLYYKLYLQMKLHIHTVRAKKNSTTPVDACVIM